MSKIFKKTAKPKRSKTVKIKDKKKEIVEESGVYKKAEFETYIIWKSLPALLRGCDKGKLMKLGVEDEMSLEMLEIKTQTEFAEKYGLKRTTCSEWKKKLAGKKIVFGSIEKWAKMITPNVIMALAKTAIRTGKAPEVMAWMRIVEGFEGKSEAEVNDDLKKILEKVNKMLPE